MQTLEQALSDPTLRARTEAFVHHPRATLRPAAPPPGHAAAPADVVGVEQRVRIEHTLGEGGMGVVHQGEQLSLRRKVAVKAPRAADGRDTDANAHSLLQEAWVAGSLEHPNIVPVHDLYLDAQGRPHIVLKRIEGRPWSSTIHRPEAGEHPDDALVRDLEIFLQVCQAIAFAHERGIVHRDLKPDNVMLGAFGEVVVLDWGIALTTREGERHVPHVSTATTAVGTPAYMAPEMLGGPVSQVGKATDVYLLGAVLHEIVTGLAPHGGASFDAVMRSILRSRPALPGRVPRELAALIERAMHPRPERRIESVVALREAVRDFLRHQGSRRLLAAAVPRRAALEAGWAAAARGEPVADARLQALFSECRFAYREALDAWPENRDAQRALTEVTVGMVEHELSRGEPSLAQAALSSLSQPPLALRARVEASVQAHGRKLEALERLARERDPETGARTRTFVALLFGVVWTTVPWWLRLSGASDEAALWLGPMVFALVEGSVLVWARESIFKTAINRFLAGALGVTLASQLAFALAGLYLGIPARALLQLTFLIWAMSATIAAFNIDLRLLLMAGAYWLGFGVALLRPDFVWQTASIANAMAVAGAAVLWAPPDFWQYRPPWLRRAAGALDPREGSRPR